MLGTRTRVPTYLHQFTQKLMPAPAQPERLPNGRRLTNRVKAIMIHCTRYWIDGQNRLAKDCNVSKSTINRLIRGETDPSYVLAVTVSAALEKSLGVPLSMREVFSTDGTYPTGCVCDLSPSCTGCFPPFAYNTDDTMKSEFKDLKPGDWCRSPQMPIPEIPLSDN